MNTYQRQLLHQLINELTATTTPNLHAAQMLAAELKGAMQAQDAPQKPTPDADGWVENTGVVPEVNISSLKFRDGYICDEPSPKTNYRWNFARTHQEPSVDITHYKPA